MSEIKCPKCGSTNIGQYRMPTGAIWCGDCGFRVEQKETGNPFINQQPKPVPVQSADELLCLIRGREKCGEDADDLIEADRAAQRQAGREEAVERYKKSVEVDEAYMRTLEKQIDRYAALEEAARVLDNTNDPTDADNERLHKALSDLDEARNG